MLSVSPLEPNDQVFAYTVMRNRVAIDIFVKQTMKPSKVGIRKFRARLSGYIAAGSPVAIMRHGHTVGFFIPARGQSDANIAALKMPGTN